MTKLYTAQQTVNDFGLMFSDDKYDTKLAASTEQTLTVPSNAAKWIAVFKYTPNVEVWVANNSTATIPGSAFAATDSEMNPDARIVAAGDVLHFISETADTEISVMLYKIDI